MRGLEAQARSKRAQKSLDLDIARIDRFLDLELEPQGRGLVLFSCQIKGLWRVYRLPIPLGAFLRF